MVGLSSCCLVSLASLIWILKHIKIFFFLLFIRFVLFKSLIIFNVFIWMILNECPVMEWGMSSGYGWWSWFLSGTGYEISYNCFYSSRKSLKKIFLFIWSLWVYLSFIIYIFCGLVSLWFTWSFYALSYLGLQYQMISTFLSNNFRLLVQTYNHHSYLSQTILLIRKLLLS